MNGRGNLFKHYDTIIVNTLLMKNKKIYTKKALKTDKISMSILSL